MLTLFHHPMFAACRFVRLAFGEYGEELALIEEKPWTRRTEFLNLNPAGTLPVLLSQRLALQTSFTFNRDATPPEGVVFKNDRTLTVGLVVTL